MHYCLTRLFLSDHSSFVKLRPSWNLGGDQDETCEQDSSTPSPPPQPPGVLFGTIPRQTGTGHMRELKPLTGMLGWLKTSTSPGPIGIRTS